jgi:hypothetical protein
MGQHLVDVLRPGDAGQHPCHGKLEFGLARPCRRLALDDDDHRRRSEAELRLQHVPRPRGLEVVRREASCAQRPGQLRRQRNGRQQRDQPRPEDEPAASRAEVPEAMEEVHGIRRSPAPACGVRRERAARGGRYSSSPGGATASASATATSSRTGSRPLPPVVPPTISIEASTEATPRTVARTPQ